MKQNVKQNNVHDEQITVAKLREEKFKRLESTSIMNKKNDFFLNCYGNKFGHVYRVQMTEYQITMKQMQTLTHRFWERSHLSTDAQK